MSGGVFCEKQQHSHIACHALPCPAPVQVRPSRSTPSCWSVLLTSGAPYSCPWAVCGPSCGTASHWRLWHHPWTLRTWGHSQQCWSARCACLCVWLCVCVCLCVGGGRKKQQAGWAFNRHACVGGAHSRVVKGVEWRWLCWTPRPHTQNIHNTTSPHTPPHTHPTHSPHTHQPPPTGG